jgi:hypothetical protein
MALFKNKKNYLIILTFLCLNNLRSQNLIRNSSFESFSMQPVLNSQGKFYYYNPNYIQIVNDWDIINSPDYFNSAYMIGAYNAPYSRFGNCNPKHGNAYAGIGVYDIRFDYQEYPTQHLTNPLKADSIYCLSFFTSRADRTLFAIKSIGALLSVNAPTLSGGYINAIPQIVNNNVFLTDTVNWIEIQGCFTAQGGEEYITIGNFNTNANIDTLRMQSTNPLTGTGTDISYYYIDSVSLWQNNFPTALKNLSGEINFEVYPNPSKGAFTVSSKVQIQKIEVINTIGQLLLSLTSSDRTNQFQFSHFEQGVYFIKISYNGGLSCTKKIIINP